MKFAEKLALLKDQNKRDMEYEGALNSILQEVSKQEVKVSAKEFLEFNKTLIANQSKLSKMQGKTLEIYKKILEKDSQILLEYPQAGYLLNGERLLEKLINEKNLSDNFKTIIANTGIRNFWANKQNLNDELLLKLLSYQIDVSNINSVIPRLEKLDPQNSQVRKVLKKVFGIEGVTEENKKLLVPQIYRAFGSEIKMIIHYLKDQAMLEGLKINIESLSKDVIKSLVLDCNYKIPNKVLLKFIEENFDDREVMNRALISQRSPAIKTLIKSSISNKVDSLKNDNKALTFYILNLLHYGFSIEEIKGERSFAEVSEKALKISDPKNKKAREAFLVSNLLYNENPEKVSNTIDKVFIGVDGAKELSEILKSPKKISVQKSNKDILIRENILVFLFLAKKTEVLRHIIKKCGNDLDLNIKSGQLKRTLLDMVIASGDFETLDLMLANKKLDINSSRPVVIEGKEKQRPIAFVLVDVIAQEKDSSKAKSLSLSLEKLLDNPAMGINKRNEEGQSLIAYLYLAMQKKEGHSNARLFSKSFDKLYSNRILKKDKINSLSESLIHLAIKHNDLDLVKKELAANANIVYEKDINGVTPFMLALKGGDVNIVKELLPYVDKTIKFSKDKFGTSTLMYACESGNPKVVEEFFKPENLEETKKFIGKRDILGQGVLHYVKDLETLRIFLTHRVDSKKRASYFDINDKNINGETPLMQAVKSRNVNMVRALVRSGADVNACDKEGVSALMRASLDGSADVVKELLESTDIDVDYRYSNGLTALSMAVINRNRKNNDMKEYFAQRNIAPSTDKDYAKICALLLDKNADRSFIPRMKDMTVVEKTKFALIYYKVILFTAIRHLLVSLVNLLMIGTKDNPLYVLLDGLNKKLMMDDAKDPLKMTLTQIISEYLSSWIDYQYDQEGKFVVGDFAVQRHLFFFKKINLNIDRVKTVSGFSQVNGDKVISNIDEFRKGWLTESIKIFNDQNITDKDFQNRMNDAKRYHKVLLNRYVQLKKLVDSSIYVSGASAHLKAIADLDKEIVVNAQLSSVEKDIPKIIKAITTNDARFKNQMLSIMFEDSLKKKDASAEIRAIISSIKNLDIIVDADTYYKVMKFEKEYEQYSNNILGRKFFGYYYGAKNWLSARYIGKTRGNKFTDLQQESKDKLSGLLDSFIPESKEPSVSTPVARLGMDFMEWIIGGDAFKERFINNVSNSSANSVAYVATKFAFVGLASRLANVPAALNVAIAGVGLVYAPTMLPTILYYGGVYGGLLTGAVIVVAKSSKGVNKVVSEYFQNYVPFYTASSRTSSDEQYLGASSLINDYQYNLEPTPLRFSDLGVPANPSRSPHASAAMPAGVEGSKVSLDPATSIAEGRSSLVDQSRSD